jgi:polyphosphate:AMP phosphotransferase
MFEAAELGRKISKTDFKKEEPELHTQLLEIQRTLRESNFPVIIIVSGVEGAGKGEVVNRLNEWLDTRGISTSAFWDESDEELERPSDWRFWRRLPPKGTVGIMFGSWYTRPIVDYVFRKNDISEFERKLQHISEFEQTLTDDGARIIKLWFHMAKKDVFKRLKSEAKKDTRISPILKKFSKRYDQFTRASERAIRITDKSHSPWHLIEALDRRYRDLTTGRIVLDMIQQKIKQQNGKQKSVKSKALQQPGEITILDHVDLDQKLTDKEYRKLLAKYQRKLYGLAWDAYKQKRSSVAVFEGWDAAGKGGAIRRITAATDARLYQVISVAAPTDEEKAHHYLWRFWRHLPRAGYLTIYDRSWYGRVLVERVEQFAREDEWQRAYHEINQFEQQLCESGIIMIKYWVHLSQEEQLRRFKEREKIAWKMHKITEEDWRNRERWNDYTAAINDMVSHTSTHYAPWTLIAGNDKKFARVQIVKTFCNQLENALS